MAPWTGRHQRFENTDKARKRHGHARTAPRADEPPSATYVIVRFFDVGRFGRWRFPRPFTNPSVCPSHSADVTPRGVRPCVSVQCPRVSVVQEAVEPSRLTLTVDLPDPRTQGPKAKKQKPPSNEARGPIYTCYSHSKGLPVKRWSGGRAGHPLGSQPIPEILLLLPPATSHRLRKGTSASLLWISPARDTATSGHHLRATLSPTVISRIIPCAMCGLPSFASGAKHNSA